MKNKHTNHSKIVWAGAIVIGLLAGGAIVVAQEQDQARAVDRKPNLARVQQQRALALVQDRDELIQNRDELLQEREALTAHERETKDSAHRRDLRDALILVEQAQGRKNQNQARGNQNRYGFGAAPNSPPVPLDPPTMYSVPPNAFSFSVPAGGNRVVWANKNHGWHNIDPEMAKQINASNTKVLNLTKQLRESENTTEKEDLKSDLQTELESQYDLYLAQHEKPLKDLEARLEKLREEFEYRKKSKGDLVKLRVDTIWYESQGLGWPGATGSTNRFPTSTGNLFDRSNSARAGLPMPNAFESEFDAAAEDYAAPKAEGRVDRRNKR